MINLFRYTYVILFVLCFGHIAHAQDCNVGQKAFKGGEKITYKVYYNWDALWVPAGEVDFTVSEEEFRKWQVFYFKGSGKTYRSYDWFFKVRDTYESYVNKETLLPYYFKRNVLEGSYYFTNQYVFSHRNDKIYSVSKKLDKPIKQDTLITTNCTYDVLSIIYYARCIDFSKYEVNEKIPITIVLDKEISNIYIRYLGKGELQTEKHGKFNCIKFSPLLVAGSIFEGGEQMQVWVSDDDNKIPLLIESPISVGSIKARIKSYEGLKFPLDSKID